MSNKHLILLRGLPGTGKSTLAKVLSENKYPIFSIDDFFTDPSSGKYTFEFDKNHLAYKNCESRCEQAMKDSIPKIFIDNVFSIDWEIKPYFLLAHKYAYAIFVLTVENYHGNKNIHGITEEQIQKMASKYQVKLIP